MDWIQFVLVALFSGCFGALAHLAFNDWFLVQASGRRRRAEQDRLVKECGGDRQLAQLHWTQRRIADAQIELLRRRMGPLLFQAEDEPAYSVCLQFLTESDMPLMQSVTTGRISLCGRGGQTPLMLLDETREFLANNGFTVSECGKEAVYDGALLGKQARK